MKTLTCFLLFTLTTLGMLKTSAAAPPNTHAVVHIKNESTAQATIYYNFNKGYKWRKEVLQIGETLNLSYAYDGTAQKSPPCLIKLDVNTQGRHIVEYSLVKGASADPNNFGTRYTIKQIRGTHTRFLEASSPKARVEVTDKNGFIPTTVN
jgi:hypothetical protein